MRCVAIFIVAFGAAGCRRAEPPAPAGIDAAVAPLPPPAASPHAGPVPSAVASAAQPAASAATTTTTSAATSPAPPSGGVDPGTLEQTRDQPSSESAPFQTRLATLFRAIVEDDPAIGMPAFFPVTAYAQVKDVANPRADWKRRLVNAYERDIHALHESLGSRAREAKLLRIEVPSRSKWIEPGEEYNKIGYHRVYGTKIIYAFGESTRERTIPISSLISWRGEWYVVHLTGFK